MSRMTAHGLETSGPKRDLARTVRRPCSLAQREKQPQDLARQAVGRDLSAVLNGPRVAALLKHLVALVAG